MKGKGMAVLHVYRDSLWVYGGRKVPNDGFGADQISPAETKAAEDEEAVALGQQRGRVTPPRRWDVPHQVCQVPLHRLRAHVQIVRLVDNARLVVLGHAAAAKDDRLLADHLPTRRSSMG